MQELTQGREGSLWEQRKDRPVLGKKAIPPALCLEEEALGDYETGTEIFKIQREGIVSCLTQEHKKECF